MLVLAAFGAILSACVAVTAQTPAPVSPAAPLQPLPSQPSKDVPAIDPNAVVIEVGDTKITAGQFKELVKSLPQQYQEIAGGEGRRAFAQNLAEIYAMAQEARKRNLDKDKSTALQIEFQKDNLLAQSMYQTISQTAQVTDADVQAYYDAHRNEFETLTGRHILIRMKGSPVPLGPGKQDLTDDEAKAKAESIRKRLQAGEDFAKIAKEESDDTGSGDKGGDLGEFGKGMMVAPFEQAAFALKPGEISEPVHSEFGYHIIQIQEHKTKTLAELKPTIQSQLMPNAARNAVSALVDKSRVEINEAYFGPAAGGTAK